MSYSICLGEGATPSEGVDFEFVVATPGAILRAIMTPSEYQTVNDVVKRAMQSAARDCDNAIAIGASVRSQASQGGE